MFGVHVLCVFGCVHVLCVYLDALDLLGGDGVEVVSSV